MAQLSSRSAHATRLGGDSDQCFGRSRIFDCRACQPELDIADGLRSNRSLIDFCNVRRDPQHSGRLHGLDCDLQAVAITIADIGYIGWLHPIAGCGRGVVAA